MERPSVPGMPTAIVETSRCRCILLGNNSWRCRWCREHKAGLTAIIAVRDVERGLVAANSFNNFGEWIE